MENIESKKGQLGSTHYYCILQGLGGGWWGGGITPSLIQCMPIRRYMSQESF
jgi:hypothetical protein